MQVPYILLYLPVQEPCILASTIHFTLFTCSGTLHSCEYHTFYSIYLFRNPAFLRVTYILLYLPVQEPCILASTIHFTLFTCSGTLHSCEYHTFYSIYLFRNPAFLRVPYILLYLPVQEPCILASTIHFTLFTCSGTLHSCEYHTFYSIYLFRNPAFLRVPYILLYLPVQEPCILASTIHFTLFTCSGTLHSCEYHTFYSIYLFRNPAFLRVPYILLNLPVQEPCILASNIHFTLFTYSGTLHSCKYHTFYSIYLFRNPAFLRVPYILLYLPVQEPCILASTIHFTLFTCSGTLHSCEYHTFYSIYLFRNPAFLRVPYILLYLPVQEPCILASTIHFTLFTCSGTLHSCEYHTFYSIYLFRNPAFLRVPYILLNLPVQEPCILASNIHFTLFTCSGTLHSCKYHTFYSIYLFRNPAFLRVPYILLYLPVQEPCILASTIHFTLFTCSGTLHSCEYHTFYSIYLFRNPAFLRVPYILLYLPVQEPCILASTIHFTLFTCSGTVHTIFTSNSCLVVMK